MPETTERDPLADAFFTFRMDAPHEIIAPGTTAARKTVTRRRTAQTVLVTASVAAVLATIGLTARAGNDSMPPSAPAQSSTPEPTLSLSALMQLGDQALLDLKRAYPGKNLRNVVNGQLDSHSDGFKYEHSSGAKPNPAGVYTFVSTCLGTGTAQVRWIAGGQTISTTVTCGAGISQTTLELPETTSIVTLHAPDGEAQGRAGIATAVIFPSV